MSSPTKSIEQLAYYFGDAPLVHAFTPRAVQQALDFPGTVYGVDRSGGMAEIMRRQAAFYAAHDDDVVLDDRES